MLGWRNHPALVSAAACLATACLLRIPLQPWHLFMGASLGTAMALFVMLLLAREMFWSWPAALISAGLLYINPAFVYTGLTPTIHVDAASVTLLMIYFCWQLWQGESKYWLAAALALGVGSCFRPELLPLLSPLWAVSAWRAKRDWKDLAKGLAVVAAFSAVWIAFLLTRYPLLYGAPWDGWLRMLGMLLAWNGTALAGWILFAWHRPSCLWASGGFLALWTLPVLAFQAALRIGAADRALATIPAFCLAGGCVLASLAKHRPRMGALALLFALTLKVYLFRHPVGLYADVSVGWFVP